MRFIYLFFLIVLSGAYNVPAKQNADSSSQGKTPFVYVDKMPKASYDINRFLAKNIRYPKKARRNKIEGKVIIKFVVNEDGSISDCQVMKSIDENIDEEALRVVRSFPKWQPGEIKGKPIKVYFTLPIVFSL